MEPDDFSDTVNAGMPTEREKKQAGARLALTRRALGYDTQTRFVKALNSVYPMTTARWNNYETGDLRVTVPVALAMCVRFDLSLDWIYRGVRANLPPEIRQKIEDREIADREGR